MAKNNYQLQKRNREVVPIIYNMAAQIVYDGRVVEEEPLRDASVERKFRQFRKTGADNLDQLADECAKMPAILGEEEYLARIQKGLEEAS